jgi:uncharacterized protein
MADFQIPKHGSICWRELATKDLDAATEFYSKLFGWNIEQSKISPTAYKEIQIKERASGGMMEIDEKWGPNPPPSSWTTYIAVDDADEAARRVVSNGGSLRMPPFEAPGVGRMVWAIDPSGASFAMIQFHTAV